jgi:hypothetical protein
MGVQYWTPNAVPLEVYESEWLIVDKIFEDLHKIPHFTTMDHLKNQIFKLKNPVTCTELGLFFEPHAKGN